MKKRNICLRRIGGWGVVLVMVLALLLPVSITAQNVLRVADFTAPAEKETVVPIYLDNGSEVVGLQFDITLPYKIGSGKVTLVDERSNGHSIYTRKLSDTKYTVIVMSLQNQPLRGNSGLLIRFPIKVAADAQADDTKPVTLTDIVLTGRNGSNVATQTTTEGTFTVQRTPTPDFVVDEDLKIAGADETLVPGGQMRLEFTVINQGSGDSKNGWSEKIYLEDLTGQRTYVTAQKYGNTLPAGERMWRSYEVTLPNALHLEGEVMAVVELVALKSNDELIADQGNNMKWSSNTKTLEKRLFLSATRVVLKEGKQQSVTLTRSGDWTMAETFNVCEYNDHGSNMLSLPATVTIPAKKAGVSFYVKAPDNSEVNPEYRTGLKVTGDDYPELTMIVDVEDDDSYPLTLVTDKPFYMEGDPLTLTAKIGKALDHDLKVDIAKTNAQRFYPYIRSITIPAGQTSASAETVVVNDGYPMVDANVTFTGTATGFVMAKCTVGIQDDDWPTLKMELSQTLISEGDGYGATMATVTRIGNVSENLTVYLSYKAKSVPVGANTKELFFDSQYVIIPAGESSVSFPVSVEDNSQLDGTRVWTVTVAACDAATGKPVGSGHKSITTADLTVTDDDTDKILKLQCSTATLPEAGKKATLTLTRNSNIGDETFNLIAEGADLNMPETVTIKNGSKTVTFQVSAKADYTTEDNYYARVTASADGYQPTQFVFMVSTLPDAVGALPALAEGNYYGGITYDITLNVTNKGTSTLEPGMEVYFYLLNKSVYNPDDPNLTVSDLFKTKLPNTVPAGETVPMTFSIELPTYYKEQMYWLMAWLNPRQKTAESNKLNGITNTTPINIKLPYTLESVSTDKYHYTRGDTILFTGKMINAESGIAMEGKLVDVYMVNDTKRYQTQGTLDAGGNFTARYKVGEQTGGLYKVGACVHGAGSSETQTYVNVIRLKIERKNYLLQDITETVPLEGDISITNLSEEPVYNVTFKMIDLPEDWKVELTNITKLEGGATGDVHYRIIASKPPQAKKLISGTFIASAKTDDGQQIADSEMPVYFWWYAAKCKLVADKVNTTLYRLGQRQVVMTVENAGVIESGSIRVECSSGQSWLSLPSTQLASIAKDGKATVTLNLTGNENLIVDGTYEALVRLTPQNGDKLDVKVKCTVVSTDIGRLVVDVVDAYTLGADDGNGPHVSGATVKVTNAFNGEVAITGTTGEDGIFATDYETNKLKEGTYYVYVTAPNHFYAEKTITVEPGVDNPLEVFLNYETVKITYTVERTKVTDEYKTVLLMDIVPDIPQAIVVPDLPNTWGRGQHAFSITLTNKGRLTAYTPFLEFPNVDGVTFEVKSEYPSIIYPNESFDVTVEFTGPEDAQETYLGHIKMHYAYKLRGDMYWGCETYMCTMGYGEIIILPGGGMPMAGSDREGRNFGKYIPPTGGASGGTDFSFDDLGSTGSHEPEILVRDYTKSIDNRIRLQFEQKFLLEREAFKGHLKVENLQMNAIEDVMMTPNVKRLDGTDATDLFSITTQGIEKWAGKDRWDLASSETGEALVLYVPSKETAPIEPVEYLFGGTVTYRNVADGKLVTVEVTPTKLAVNPSPDLHLTYFVQRDFIGDDPLTEEVEPWEPAQFALLIQNKGAGEALNLEIETSDPTIVDNACNLPVEFTKLNCTIDGKEYDYDFNKLKIGKIAPGQNIMARWWYYCNVAAHVANYEVYMTKHSNYGSEFDLITIDGVRELTRSLKGSIQAPAAGAPKRTQGVTDNDKESNIFLLNLIADADNLPDHVIDQDGNETDDLEIVSDNATCAAAATSGQYLLTVTASRQGWVYGDVHDPTNCTMQLVKAVRNSDGADVTANVWQTDRTVTSNNSVIVDNRLHWADNIGTTETYTLYYEPKPAAAPQVKSIELVVNENTPEAKATSAIVTFVEAVDTNTLDAEDFVISCEDMMYQPEVTVKNSTSCLINWGGDILIPGEYSLTVFTSGIKNAEGTIGTTNKSLNWISEGNIKMGDANRDGNVDLTDAISIVNRMVGKPTSVFIKEAADVNRDGIVDIADAVRIVNLIVGKINSLAPRHEGNRPEPE